MTTTVRQDSGIHAAGPATLRIESLHGSLDDPSLDSMNLLNEVAQRFPDAVSFAAGRPYEGFFDVEEVHRHLRTFCEHLSVVRGWSEEEVRRLLFQYGRTKGVIHDLVAKNLAVDEGFEPDPESVVITVGCQEAMFLVLRALRTDDRDVVLAVSPTYVGLTGAAQLADLPVLPVRAGDHGVDLEDLARTVRQARAEGLRPRACYVIPDFSNPLGVSLDLDTRRRLLDLAEELDLLLLEDNPYGLFPAGSARLPTLKALDTRRRVVYFGSFAKSALPGARVGYVVADQLVTDDTGRRLGLLADQLAKVKSMLTVNTSPLAQAVVAGKLLESDYSLARANTRQAELYRSNLQLMLRGLAERFPPGSGVTWNTPGGGFFLVLTVPYRTDDALLEHSARQHRVIWTPMHHFYAGRRHTHQIRLSFSLLQPQQIRAGLDGLAALVREQRSGR
ncbi:PLP-dependent aminotransferase family protein [Streptomyces sp. NBC_01176]|uniref:aminotransferase-like domain-containing protein n=1 Tax=Streptomyces sp. NBC_01176 TaxID=2903760 RepID=UPI003867EEB3|nr:PLP-dependent aminotransferase family protein [Streptomyces sp. NBC_01176]